MIAVQRCGAPSRELNRRGYRIFFLEIWTLYYEDVEMDRACNILICISSTIASPWHAVITVQYEREITEKLTTRARVDGLRVRSARHHRTNPKSERPKIIWLSSNPGGFFFFFVQRATVCTSIATLLHVGTPRYLCGRRSNNARHDRYFIRAKTDNDGIVQVARANFGGYKSKPKEGEKKKYI